MNLNVAKIDKIIRLKLVISPKQKRNIKIFPNSIDFVNIYDIINVVNIL